MRMSNKKVKYVFKCRVEKNGNEAVTLHFWCPRCKKEHIHGEDIRHLFDKSDTVYPRVAHCTYKDSPFKEDKENGYWLAIDKSERLRAIKDFRLVVVNIAEKKLDDA